MTTTKHILRIVAAVGLQAAFLAACGSEASYQAELSAPVKREAKLTVSPALDVSALIDPSLADRIVIDDITLNLSEVRLLGADPRIPAGGFRLTGTSRILSSAPGEEDALSLPFPEQFLEDDDLAVFLRLEQSPVLEGASVVVRARLFSSPVVGSLASLTSNETGATDPDGEPSKDPSKTGATDPDGEPSYQDRCGATDPDGEPSRTNRCRFSQTLSATETRRSVAFELRDNDATNLIAYLDKHSELGVVVGIPAARWFTPEAVSALDQALEAPTEVVAQEASEVITKPGKEMPDVIVLQSKADAVNENPADKMAPGEDDYFIASGGRSARGTVRRE